jgi:hypothetical protein
MSSFIIVAAFLCAIEVAARLYIAFSGNSRLVASSQLDPTKKMSLYRTIFPDLSEEQISAIFSVTYRQVYAPLGWLPNG